MNWRDLPHLSYGNYGGGHNTSKICCEPPVDEMDYFFYIHDITLKEAGNDKLKKYYADYELYYNLKEVEIKSIKIPVYGHLYLVSCLFIFGIIIKFGKPKENR